MSKFLLLSDLSLILNGYRKCVNYFGKIELTRFEIPHY